MLSYQSSLGANASKYELKVIDQGMGRPLNKIRNS